MGLNHLIPLFHILHCETSPLLLGTECSVESKLSTLLECVNTRHPFKIAICYCSYGHYRSFHCISCPLQCPWVRSSRVPLLGKGARLSCRVSLDNFPNRSHPNGRRIVAVVALVSQASSTMRRRMAITMLTQATLTLPITVTIMSSRNVGIRRKLHSLWSLLGKDVRKGMKASGMAWTIRLLLLNRWMVCPWEPLSSHFACEVWSQSANKEL